MFVPLPYEAFYFLTEDCSRQFSDLGRCLSARTLCCIHVSNSENIVVLIRAIAFLGSVERIINN